MNDWHDNREESIDLGDVAAGADRASQQFEELLRQPVPLHSRISQWFGGAVAYGKPKFSKLPPSIREDAQALGFQPCCNVLWGHYPILMMSTPQFIGPEGFVKLECYRGNRFYMQTMFADGSAITHTNNPVGGTNLKTTYLQSSGDFRRDYETHKDAVRKYVSDHGTLPIFTPTPKLILKRYAVVYRHQGPPSMVVLALTTQAMLVFSFVYLVVLLLR
ncbi:MAG: hypothetical protein R3E66_23660 [bacterium]